MLPLMLPFRPAIELRPGEVGNGGQSEGGVEYQAEHEATDASTVNPPEPDHDAGRAAVVVLWDAWSKRNRGANRAPYRRIAHDNPLATNALPNAACNELRSEMYP